MVRILKPTINPENNFKKGLKPGVGNGPVITHAHLSQVDQIA